MRGGATRHGAEQLGPARGQEEGEGPQLLGQTAEGFLYIHASIPVFAGHVPCPGSRPSKKGGSAE